MTFGRYVWLVTLCAVFAPVLAGLLLGVVMFPSKAEAMSDIFAMAAMTGGFALLAGFVPGLASGLALAILRWRNGWLSLPVVLLTVLFFVTLFVAWLEFANPGASPTFSGFLEAVAIMAVPAWLSAVVLWLLRKKIGLKEMTG